MLVLRLGRAALTAVALSAVTLAQLNMPTKEAWDGLRWLLYASVSVLAFQLCYDAVRSVDQAVTAGRLREYDRKLRMALSATVASIVDEFGVPWDEVGVYHYQLVRPWRRQRLNRVGGVLAGATPLDVQPYFPVGKGVVGAAVRQQCLVAVAWRDFVQRWIARTPQQWAAQDARDRYGLNWGELMRSERPEGVVANPVFSTDGRPNGCTLVTGPLKPDELSGDRMRRILSDTATQLYHLGPAPRGWWRNER